MTLLHSKVLPGSQKMRRHVTMVFAWSEPTDIFLYCGSTIRDTSVCDAIA